MIDKALWGKRFKLCGIQDDCATLQCRGADCDNAVALYKAVKERFPRCCVELGILDDEYFLNLSDVPLYLFDTMPDADGSESD